MSIVIKPYITVHSNTEPSTVTTFPRKTVGKVFLYMGNILLEALVNISVNFHLLIYTSEIIL